jgi:hypothetical protein
VENKENIFLRYIYYSEPTFGEATTNKYGEGCTKLWLSEENGIKKLSGRYFSAKLVKGTLLLSKKT